VRTFVLATALVVVTAASAAAQSAGVRTGVSGSPDQFYFGLHFETEPLIEQVRFKPNFEVGLGSGQTVAAINLEFVGKVPIKSRGRSISARVLRSSSTRSTTSAPILAAASTSSWDWSTGRACSLS
jgi:hypothetical protein